MKKKNELAIILSLCVLMFILLLNLFANYIRQKNDGKFCTQDSCGSEYLLNGNQM